jgi:hypothetical protein
MPPLMAAHVMKMCSGRRYTYIFFASFSDILVLVAETGHMICRANDAVHQLVANDSGHAKGVAAMTSHLDPGVLFSRFCVLSTTKYLQQQRDSDCGILFFLYFFLLPSFPSLISFFLKFSQ